MKTACVANAVKRSLMLKYTSVSVGKESVFITEGKNSPNAEGSCQWELTDTGSNC